MKPVVTGADIHGIHEFEKGSIDDAGYGNPMFLAIYGFHCENYIYYRISGLVLGFIIQQICLHLI